MQSQPKTTPQGCTHFKLRQLQRRVSLRYDRELAACGLKTTQYSLLTHIEKLQPIAQTELAMRMGMDASTLSRNLRPLIANGWVALDEAPDARSHALALTDEGKALRKVAQTAWKRAQLGLNAAVGDAKVARLHRLIDEFTEALETA